MVGLDILMIILLLSQIYNNCINTACTGIQEVALLRSKLESLHMQVNEAENVALSNEQFCKQLKICCDMCEEAYHKLGEEHCRYVEDFERLKKQEEALRQTMEDITEQGSRVVYKHAYNQLKLPYIVYK